MKLLAFSDLHLSSTAFKKLKSKVKKQNPDLLICAGDVSIFEQGLNAILSKLNKLKKKTLMPHGNHETDNVLKRFCKRYKNMIFIPVGFAHGYLVLSERAEIVYKISKEYSREHERGFFWKDPTVGIEWPLPAEPILSEKDKKLPLFKDLEDIFLYQD